MRALALVVLAGCFNPRLASHLQCEAPDNWCPPPQTCGSDGFCSGGTAAGDAATDGIPGANFVFLSSATITPSDYPTAIKLLTAADTMCTGLGQKLRPGGTFVAAIGTTLTATITDVISRVPATTGWIRADGKPFAASKAELELGHILYPMRFDDDGTDVVTLPDTAYPKVLTSLDSPCSSVGYGAPDGDGPAWLHVDAGSCSSPAYLYCFETDRTTPVVAPAFDSTLLVGFVTNTLYSVDGGVTSLDTYCQNEGHQQQPNRMFKALVAPNGATVRMPFIGSTKPWQRFDGVVFADAQLKGFTAALDITPTGLQLNSSTATGTTGFTIPGIATGNCSNWGTTTGSPNAGETSRSSNFAIYGGSADCSSAHLYCLEVP